MDDGDTHEMPEPTEKDKTSSLGYAILSLLARRDRTGYELSRFAFSPRNHLLWSAGHSQIYPELARLAADGYVTFSTVEQTRRPDKKVYRLTAAGERRLRDWMHKDPKPAPVRNELNVKAHAAWLLEPAEAAALFRRQVEQAEQEIKDIETHMAFLERQYETVFPPSTDNPLFGTYALIRLAIDGKRQLIDWCRWMEREYLDLAARKSRKSA